MNHVSLMLCCNHPRNGSFTGLLRAVSVHGTELESPYDNRHLKIAIAEHHFVLGKSRQWLHHGHGTWVGNWCWDAVRVTPAVAADVLNFVLGKKYVATVLVGERMIAALDAQRPLTAEDILSARE